MDGCSKIKVAALCGISRNAGGVFYAVSSLCKELRLSGVEVSAMGDARGLTDEDRAVWDAVPLIPYKAIGPLGSGIGLRRNLVQSGADLVHQHGLWLDDQWASLHWQRKTNRPVVISPHGMLDPWAVRNSAWKKKLVGALFANESLRKSACIHALCQSEADSIRKYGLDNPIVVIPNGVELPEIRGRRTEARGRKQLLFLGRIHPKKGLEELIQAWGMEHGTWRNDWQLLVAGWDDGNYLAGLKKLASQLGLLWSDATLSETPSSDLPSSPRLRRTSRPSVFAKATSDRPSFRLRQGYAGQADLCFIGPAFGREKEALLRRVDGFILPSFSEGLPMSVLEAWSYGLPVLMTEFCNIPEGFESGAALRIEPNAESIAHGLTLWMEMVEEDRETMGNHGRVLVERKFTWKKIAQDMRSVYENCVSGKISRGANG